MNAAVEVSRLLNESGAVLVRQNKHLVYRLPNGQTFVAAKTPSDPARAAKNNLSQLRRALGIVRETPDLKGEESAMPVAVAAAPANEPSTQAPQEPTRKDSLKERIEAAITTEEAIQEKLLADAQAHERRVHMLKALLPFTDDPAIEDSLRGVLPALEPPAPPKPALVPEPPQAITERVQVTRQLVLAATQTFEDTFTVNDVLGLMTGGRQIDKPERQRVRSSILGAMITLRQHGELIMETQAFGKRQATWRKAILNGNGRRDGVGSGRKWREWTFLSRTG